MKTPIVLVVTLALPLLVGACNRDEDMGMSLSALSSTQQEVATLSPDQMIEKAPTAAGMEPAWMTMSYSESLRSAYAERIFGNEEGGFVNE